MSPSVRSVPSVRSSFARVAGACLLGGALALLPTAAVAASAPHPAPSPAPVQEAGATLEGLEAALRDRLGDLTDLSNPSASQQQEIAGLQDALAATLAFDGGLNSYFALLDPLNPGVQTVQLVGAKQEMEKLVAAAMGVDESGTADDDVLFQVGVVRNLIDAFGLETRQFAFSVMSLIDPGQARDMVQELIDIGDKVRNQALIAWADDLSDGAKTLAAAWVRQHEAAEFGRDLYAAQLSMNPVSLVPLSAVPASFDAQPNDPIDVNVRVDVDKDIPELSLVLRGFQGGSQLQSTIGELTLFNVPAGVVEETMTATFPTFAAEDVLELDGYQPSVMAMDGNTVIIGEPGPNRVRLVERIEGGIWRDVGISAGFSYSSGFLGLFGGGSIVGRAVDIDGDRAAVSSSTFVEFFGVPVGWSQDVQILERAGPGTPFGIVASIEAPGTFLLDFGVGVALDGDTLVVGDPGLGDAFVYDRVGGSWGLTRSLADEVALTFPNLSPLFGRSVALDGDVLVVGSSSSDEAFAFVGPDWQFPIVTEEFCIPLPFGGELCAPIGIIYTGWLRDLDSPPGSEFGASVSVDGSVIVVGAPGYDGGPVNGGAAFVWERVDGVVSSGEYNYTGTQFFDRGTLTAPGRVANDRYGQSVGVDGQVIVVGSPGHDHSGLTDPGSVYVWADNYPAGCPPVFNAGASQRWGLVARRSSPTPQASAKFGGGSAISDDSIAVGEIGSVVTYRGMIPVWPGDYRIGLEVDPFDRIPEPSDTSPDGNDNLFVPETNALNVAFCSPALDQPKLVVESVELVPIDENAGPTDGFIIADQNGLQLSRAGLNVVVAMNGSFDGPLGGAFLTADMLVSATGSQTFEVRFLDEATGLYRSTFPLPVMQVGDVVSVHADVEISGPALTQESYGLTVVTDVNPPINVTNFAAPGDATDTLSGQHYTVLNFQECSYAAGFEKQMGNDDFNVTGDFMASLDLAASFDEIPGNPANLYPEALGEFGAIGALTAGVDLTLMGANLGDLVRWRTMLERDPTYEYDPILYPPILFPELADGGYGFVGSDLFFRNPFTGQQDVIYAVGPYDSIDLSEASIVLPESIELTDGGFTFTYDDFSKEKKVEKEKTFFPGGVPVTVKGEAAGKIGIDLILEVTNRLKFDIAPNVELKATANLAVGDCDFTCVGAEGEITLIKDTFAVTSGLGMTVTEGPDLEDPSETAQALGALACFQVTNTIEILSGEISAFAVWPWIKWCSAWGIPYPCGGYLKKAKIPIIDWDGLEYEQELFSVSEPLCCVPVVGLIGCDTDPDAVCGDE